MNGRVYDPVLGRFLSPDNFVQAPDFTQNFNRYAYCLNNPMMYSDPSGNAWLSHFAGWVGEKFGSGFRGIGNALIYAITFPPSLCDAVFNWDLSRLDPTYSGTISNNAIKIRDGMFQGTPMQVASRFYNENPQTGLGIAYSEFLNYIGKVHDVSYYDGATVSRCYGDYLPFAARYGGTGLTLGSFILGNNTIAAEPNNPLFQHEYGHYLQSQEAGRAYLACYALPSLWGDNKYFGHKYNPVEQDANARAIKYFYENTDGNFRWYFYDNPIGYPGKYWTMNDYNTPQFQLLLSRLKIEPSLIDYASWAIGLIHVGKYHSKYYRMNPINYQ